MNILMIVKGADDGMLYHVYPFSKAKNCKKLVIVRDKKFIYSHQRLKDCLLALLKLWLVGLVPIVTNAGSDKDHIKDGQNGLLFKFGNAE